MAQSKEPLQPNSPTSHRTPQTSISLSHHQRRCSICRHPDRYWIEEDFLRWRSSWEIKTEYDLTDRSSIYRHARAFGLLALRKHNLRSALELLIEQVEDVKPSATAIVRAIRAYTRLTDDGAWIDPPHHTIITHTTAPAPPSAAHTPLSPDPPEPTFFQPPASSLPCLPRGQPKGANAKGFKPPERLAPPVSSLENVVPAASSNSPDAAFRSLATMAHKVRTTLARNKRRAQRRQRRPLRSKSPQNETKSSSTR